ncbi:MAG: hypothetical protein K0S86_5778 [Geminicoccaceae bacterium]|nr:hypothetical protein [Geminicoccaceae bacterium]
MGTNAPKHHYVVTATPLPSVPWLRTGNHWLSLPCIHPADGSVHAIGMLHRGARAAVEFAGGPEFADAKAPPLARLAFSVNGTPVSLAHAGLAWERALEWLPTFTATVAGLVVRGTIFAPYGRDADTAGVVYAIAVENRTGADIELTVVLDGTLGHRQLRIRTPRPFEDVHSAMHAPGDIVVLKGAALPGLAALAVGSDNAAAVQVGDGSPATYALRRDFRVPAGQHADVAFYIAAGPEQDGAHATVSVMRRRGWRELLSATRDALRDLEQTTGHESLDRLINRNLLLAYFYGVGRALDDAHFYFVRTRTPWHGRGVTFREWESLTWTLPAVQLADASLGRELILRACEVHGYAPGSGVRYLDGTLFEPGFCLEAAASYALAVDRYIRETNDDQIVEEPVLADTLYVASDDLAARRDQQVPLYSTEVVPSGSPAPLPYTLHGNAVVAQALDVLRRTLDEETARDVQDPEAVRAALKRHFSRDREGKTVYASAIDLNGNAVVEDDPFASIHWLPVYDVVDRNESTYRRTVRAASTDPRFLVQQCGRLLGPDAGEVMKWLRRAPLDDGFAAEQVDESGRAVSNGGDASVAGLLAHTLWYAVHALGVVP